MRPEGMGSVGSGAVPFLVDRVVRRLLIDHLKIEAMPASPARRDAGGSVDPGDVADHLELAVADQVSDFADRLQNLLGAHLPAGALLRGA